MPIEEANASTPFQRNSSREEKQAWMRRRMERKRLLSHQPVSIRELVPKTVKAVIPPATVERHPNSIIVWLAKRFEEQWAKREQEEERREI